MNTLQIVGRRSSHFTRLTRVFAEELGVPYEIVPIYDMTVRDRPRNALPTSSTWSQRPELGLAGNRSVE